MTMTEPQGPLDTIPKVNYPPILTLANYDLTKQMIRQVLSEDQDYVSWKLKSFRTGGTMNSFLQTNLQHQREQQQANNVKEKENRVKKPSTKNQINNVPKNVKFIRDIYETIQAEEIKQNRIKELDHDEQFKLLVTNLDEDQTNRFEVFHRTSLNKSQVKKLAGTVTNQSINDNIRVFLQAIGKIFAGEIIEKALDVKLKWLMGKMVCEFDRRKEIGVQLEKYLKKLTLLLVKEDEVGDEYINDGVIECSPDPYFDDEKEEMKFIKEGNKLLGSKDNTQVIRLGLISHYNTLVKEFNKLDVSVEKYNNSPLLPEHIREAWRLYRLENDTVSTAQWRRQGERSGTMFR
ncbi:TATA-binding protein-associated factor TAF11 NDAI_0H01690 [Naumovozyma dairenensis CBS 421]|uniref:TAFII28-like protein domain-containing protein n=1 Tax=Naumovozyma dairenensis (strain ATCC 10597 / BCRC 20456 / CBS 421 / NBRC 0211 / NRRL Y-12639) TaxID=1071378 RepID=G0WEY2_NAUDC|nr:hypothetical protein NDAI_0H01690 [Naumovozyma dairenensis CBS 421]CCD26343.1 hypothetical protein NDAI_0H01690 [Naumovozyma dairenensis CBS 421]